MIVYASSWHMSRTRPYINAALRRKRWCRPDPSRPRAGDRDGRAPAGVSRVVHRPRAWLLRSPLAADLSAVVVLAAIWTAAGPNSVAEISGDARYYLALWREPRAPTAPPFTYRVLTPWLARLSGLDAFWAFAVVTILGLAVAGVLLWAVVLHDRPPRQAWLALGLFVVSPAAVYALADHYLVDPVAYAFLAGVLLLHRNRLTLAAVVCVAGLLDKEPVLFAAPIVLLLAMRTRAWAPMVVILAGAPALYLVIHRTNWIANDAGREFPYSPKATSAR
jgi:hypothetical protein